MMSLILFNFHIIIKRWLKDIRQDMKQWTMACCPTILPFRIVSVEKLEITSIKEEHFRVNQYEICRKAKYNILKMKFKQKLSH